MLSVRKIAVTSLVFLAVFSIALLFVSCHVNSWADKSGQVFKLDAILTGEDIQYEGSYGSMLEEVKADAKGGEAKYFEEVYEAGLCSALFEWKFDKDITKVKADEEIGVRLSYKIDKDECVDKMAGNLTAFSVNNSYYEYFPMGKFKEKLKEKYPENAKFVQGHQGVALELEKTRSIIAQKFKMKFPEPAEKDSYYDLRFSIYRYYMSNNPIAVYVFKAD